MVESWGGRRESEMQLKHLVTKLRDQCLWRWVAAKGIRASEALPPHNRCLPRVSYKERPGISLLWHPLRSRRRAQRTPGHPKSTAPAQEEHLAPRRAVHLSPASAQQARRGGTPGLLTAQPCSLLWNKTQPRGTAAVQAPQAASCAEGHGVVQEDGNTSRTLQLLPACIPVASCVGCLWETHTLR